MNKMLSYACIAAIHIGFLALPCGDARASVMTIQVGQPLTFFGNGQVQASANDTDTPITGRSLYVYQEADWFNWPIFASDGTPITDYQLVYDGETSAIPETPTWLMCILGAFPFAYFASANTRRRATAMVFVAKGSN